MLGNEPIEVEPDRRPVDDQPFARDHYSVGPMRAAKNQRRERIVRAQEARLVAAGLSRATRRGPCLVLRAWVHGLQAVAPESSGDIAHDAHVLTKSGFFAFNQLRLFPLL
jgi:hypothetical protein